MRTTRTVLMTGAAVVMLVAGAARAQTQAAPADRATETDAASDIIVTAQKREQNLQDVPIAISVVGGDQLRETGASQLIDLSGYVPGLQVDSTGTPGQSTLSLRGVAPVGPGQTVGTYLDDTPVGSSSFYGRSVSFALDLLPYDVQRIEVLKGPQGTLYGASSIGGLLHYVTVAPQLDETTARIGFEGFDIRGGENLGTAAQALVNVPLVPGKLAIVGSVAYRRSPGWVDNVQTGADDINDYTQGGGRVALRWAPTSELSVRLTGIWQKVDSANNGAIIEDLAGVPIGNGRATNNYLDEPFSKSLQYYAGTIDYDFGFATVTSATSWSDTKTRQTGDASRVFGTLVPLLSGGALPDALTPFTLRLDLKKFTQELRLTSAPSDRFEWLVGGFYTHEKSGNQQLVRTFFFDGTPLTPLDPLAIAELPSKYKEYAAFGNATIKFGKVFEITGGLRWARNEQDFRQISSGAIVPLADDPGSSKEDVLTFSVSPQLHLADRTMLYARVASGYRPGGPNATLPGVDPIVDSDTLTSYEIGLKSELGNRFSIDLAGYYLDWKDIQLVIDFGGVTGLSNAGKARIYGAEASFVWQPVTGLRIGANGAYVDARLSSTPPPSTGGADGDRLPRIPRWSGALTGDYAFDLGDYELRLGAGVRYVGRRLSLVQSNPDAAIARSYTSVDLNAQLEVSDALTLRAYARNVANSRGAVTRDLATDGLGQPVQFSVVPLQPRTIGLGLEYSFR